MYCRIENHAGEPFFVYGARHLSETTTIPTSLFVLHPGQSTPGCWDCKGILIPSDRIAVNGKSAIRGPVAMKYRDMRRITITITDGKYQCPQCNGILTPGQIDFAIPAAPYQELLGLPRRLVEL
jgi:hypothetical protein